MSRYEAVRIVMGLALVAVFAGGMIITVKNYRKWDRAVSGILSEHRSYAVETADRNAEDNSGLTGDAESDEMQGFNTGYTEEIEAGSSDRTDITDITEAAYTTDAADSAGTTDRAESADTSDIHETGGIDSALENGEAGRSADETGAGRKMSMEGFYITEITDDIFARMNGKSYPEGCTIPLSELRYVHIRHYGFDGSVQDGELIVSERIAQDVLEIFSELYEIRYQIESVRLIDEYGADDERSMENNNTSCFNYRTIAESSTLSNHAYGRAIDINPLYNPYYYVREDGSVFLQPKGSEKYLDRTVNAACIINKGDACYNIFTAHGFTWGGDWTTKKDYQHFEK